MTDETPTEARRKPPRRRISSIWIVPIIAAAIGAWMVYHNLSRIGPTITLIMSSADGIQAEKTLIKARNVEVGKVESMQLSDDLDHVIVTAQMNDDTERLLKSDTRFWVVKPRIGREGISGLGTLWYGAYIELLPGEKGEYQEEFRVLEEPPLAEMDAEGLRVELTGDNPDRLNVGDPIIYRGFSVGRIEGKDFNVAERSMHYQIFIEDDYRDLVTENTRFWSASGIALNLGSEGMRVDMGSIESLLDGGITFGVPENLPPGEPVKEGSGFTLYADKENAMFDSYDQYLEYVLLIDDSVRGLNAGSSVEYRGVRVGTVREVPYEFNSQTVTQISDIKIPVLIRFEPQRLDPEVTQTELEEWRDRLQRLFKRNLRATLKTGNLLTGSLFVDLAFYEDTAAFAVKEFNGKTVFPSVPSRLTQLDQKFTRFMDQINDLEIKPLLDKLNQNLESSQALLEDLNNLSSQVNEILESKDSKAIPADIRNTLHEVRETLDGFKPSAPAYESLNKTLQRLNRLVDDVQPFIDTINKQPNAIIFNKKPEQDPQPKARP